ncbi:MAG: hypothetical protein ACLQHF_10820 [Terracidiphilus sp.]
MATLSRLKPRGGLVFIATHYLFDIRVIPATLSIDADGVLEDQHVGDADIDGKLKKLIAHAQELANRKNAEPAAVKPAGAGN